MDENSFENSIEHMASVRETLSCTHKLGVARPNTRLNSHQTANHIRSQPKTTTNQQQNIKAQNKT